MPTLGNAPIPANDAIARPKRAIFRDQPDPLEGRITTPWIDFFTRQAQVVSQGPTRINTVPVTAQSASIAGTDISGGALGAGLYRVTYEAQITQAAGVSSSLTVSITWIGRGAIMSQSGAAMTGNTTDTVQSGTILIWIDAAAVINYGTTYVSVGAPVMQYALSVVLEQVAA